MLEITFVHILQISYIISEQHFGIIFLLLCSFDWNAKILQLCSENSQHVKNETNNSFALLLISFHINQSESLPNSDASHRYFVANSVVNLCIKWLGCNFFDRKEKNRKAFEERDVWVVFPVLLFACELWEILRINYVELHYSYFVFSWGDIHFFYLSKLRGQIDANWARNTT